MVVISEANAALTEIVNHKINNGNYSTIKYELVYKIVSFKMKSSFC